MSPQEKRKRTIIKRYGSFKEMLKRRDVRDLILGGYNGGIRTGKKGFAKWEPGELSSYAKARQRDKSGRFVSKEQEATTPELRPEDTP